MMSLIRKLVSKSQSLSSVFGDVVFDTPRVAGRAKGAFVTCRVKKSLDENEYVIGFKMKPDAYAGAEGSPTNFINFSIENAKNLRNNLERCISEYERLQDKDK